jgi:hypothetical protein
MPGYVNTPNLLPKYTDSLVQVTTTNLKPKRNVMTHVWKMNSSRCSQISVSRISNLDLVLVILPAGDTIKTPNSVRNLTMVDAKVCGILAISFAKMMTSRKFEQLPN